MIKINLLPFRAERKKENVRRQLSIYVLMVIFLLLATGYGFFYYTVEASKLNKDVKDRQKELNTYKKTDKELKEVQAKINQTKAKLNVIKTLEKNKTGPVRLLDEIAMAIPKEKLWLESMIENKGILTVKGSAMDNDTVALFMTKLEGMKLISEVNLISTKLKSLSQFKLDISDFTLTCKIYTFKEPPKPTPTKKKRRK